MRLFGYDINVSKAAEPSEKRSAGDYVFGSPVWGDVARPGVALTNAFQQVVWVYRAVSVLAEQVANMPFRFSVASGTGETLVTSGPVWATMDRRLTLVELRGTFAAEEAREVRRSLVSLVENQAVLTRAVDRMAVVLDEHTKDSRVAQPQALVAPAGPAGTR